MPNGTFIKTTSGFKINRIPNNFANPEPPLKEWKIGKNDPNKKIAVKITDDRGIESLKIINLE